MSQLSLMGAGPSSASAFSPLNISGLLAWYDARSGVTLDGSNNVSQWDDLSGNGFHLTQSDSTKRPAYTSSSAVFNNLPRLRGDGVNDALTCLSNVWTTNANTVFAVLASVSGGNTGEFFSNLQGGGNAALHFYGASETEFKRNSTGPIKTLTSATATIVTYDVTGTGAGSVENLYFNGGTATTASNAQPAISNRALYVFDGAAATTFPRKYDLAALIIYNSVLNSTNRNLVGNYLATIYNLTWT